MITLDPSTPGWSSGNAATLTTASFTPPAGSLLVVLQSAVTQPTAISPTSTIPGVTWANAARVAATGIGGLSSAAVWLGQVSVRGTGTVTAGWNGSVSSGFGCAVIIGAVPFRVQTGAAQSAAGNTGGPVSVALTLVGDGSLVVGAGVITNNASVPTPSSQQTQSFSDRWGTGGGGSANWAQRFLLPSTLTAGSVVALSDVSTFVFCYAALEILAASVPVIPPMITGQYARRVNH